MVHISSVQRLSEPAAVECIFLAPDIPDMPVWGSPSTPSLLCTILDLSRDCLSHLSSYLLHWKIRSLTQIQWNIIHNGYRCHWSWDSRSYSHCTSPTLTDQKIGIYKFKKMNWVNIYYRAGKFYAFLWWCYKSETFTIVLVMLIIDGWIDLSSF